MGWQAVRVGVLGMWGVAVLAGCPGNRNDQGDFVVPERLDQEVVEGGPNPTGISFNVTNRGTCTLALAASAFTTNGRPWLTVSPANSNINADTTVPLSVGIDVVTTALLPGTYVGSILLSGTCTTTGQPARGSPKQIAVNLNVVAVGAAIAVDSTHVGVDTHPVLDTWRDMAPAPVAGARQGHTAVWTGREMWVFGGENSTGTTQGAVGRYEPLSDTWSTMPAANAPTARVAHTAVWTGTQMLIWGGRTTSAASSATNTGAALGASWSAMSTTNAPSARAGHTAVYTGTEMIVFGGVDASGAPVGTGARYSPTTNTWTALSNTNAPSARSGHAAVWTGREMLVWGGEDAGGNKLGNGKLYNPATGTWSDMAAGGPARSDLVAQWTGAEWLLVGGVNSSGNTVADGFAYAPADNTWTDVPAFLQFNNTAAVHVWTGAELVAVSLFEKGRYNPNTATWNNVSAPATYHFGTGAAAVWTGFGMIVYGGLGAGVSNTGDVYR